MTTTNRCLLYQLAEDLLSQIIEFNQRTDKLALKLSSKIFLNSPRLSSNCASDKEVYEEIKEYLRTHNELDYSWKGSQHMNIHSFPALPEWNLHREFILTNHLWWFYFTGHYSNIYPGDYIFYFNTTVKYFDITILLKDSEGNVQQKIDLRKVNNSNMPEQYFDVHISNRTANIQIECKETNVLKHHERIYWMVFLPKYYFHHLHQYF